MSESLWKSLRQWPVRSQRAARQNAREAAGALIDQRREREDAERYVARVTGQTPEP